MEDELARKCHMIVISDRNLRNNEGVDLRQDSTCERKEYVKRHPHLKGKIDCLIDQLTINCFFY